MINKMSSNMKAPEFKPYSRQDLLNRKQGTTAHSLSLSTSHRPDMTETLLKRLKITIHAYIHLI